MTRMQILTHDDLARIADEGASAAHCDDCAALVCPGWESFPGGADEKALLARGTLRADVYDEPTLAEYHPAGTRYESADAPIAPRFHPYNRCEVWQCRQCRRAFLRYTEYGGYYVDRRIRELKAALLVDAAP